jgi:hypothetical protein
LEADNKRLQSIIVELTDKYNALDAALRAIYEEELKAARLALDRTTTLKGAAELRAANAEAQLKEVTLKLSAEIAAHIVTKETVPQLEKMISERDAQIDFLTKNVSAIELELKRIKMQSSTLQTELALAKQDRDAETVNRVELESIVTTKEDEIVFLKSMYEEKIKVLLSFDLGSDAFKAAFSNELALALRDIRAEYESILESTRHGESDAWYKAKFNEVMTITSRTTNDLAAAKEEIRNWRNKYHAVSGDLSQLRAMIGGLEAQIQQLRGELIVVEKSHAEIVAEKEVRIHGLNVSVTELICSLKELTDVKLALDAEIATYRRLLMAEDGRLGKITTELTGQKTSQQVVTTTTTTKVIVNPFIINFKEEEDYYLMAFKYCDADNSGHVTTTELKNAFEWMNKNNFMGRSKRNVSYPYVNAILKRGDVDSSLTLEYPEFCNLMRLEKRIFVEDAFAKLTHGQCGLDQTVQIFKDAGYVYNDDWLPFLKQYQQQTGTIAIEQLKPVISGGSGGCLLERGCMS